MPITDFGVTSASVAAVHFPTWAGGFSFTGNPTSSTVSTLIEEAAALVETRLYAESITASSISAGSAAYALCAKQVRRLVAAEVASNITGADPEMAKRLSAEAASWFERLAAQGATFLGDESLNTGTSDPDGPTTHISQYSLTTDAAEDMSSVLPRVRMGDLL